MASSILGAAGCQEATKPSPAPGPLTVSVVLKSAALASYTEFSPGVPLVTCRVDLHLIATGSGNAQLEDAVFRFAYGTDRHTAVDSVRLTSAEVQELWGASEIQGGDTLPTLLSVTAGAPFTVFAELGYREPGKDRRSANPITFDCGPTPVYGGPAPQVTSATVTLPPGTLRPGSVITLQYTLDSDDPLWQSSVTVSGACSLVFSRSEFLVRTVTRSHEITLPENCRVNEPIEIAVHIRDATLTEATRFTAPVTIVDVTPPTIDPTIDPRFNGLPRELNSLYFVGDTVRVYFGASDDVVLSTLIWEILPSGFTDSVSVADLPAGQGVHIPLRPEWTGSFQLRLRARDRAGLTSNVVTSTNSALLYPTLAKTVRATTVPGGIGGLTIDVPRNVVYLQNMSASRIDVLSLASMTVVASTPFMSEPWDADLSLTGDSLIIAPGSRTLNIVDLRNVTATSGSLPLPSVVGGEFPEALRVGSNGNALLVTREDNRSRLVEVSLPAGPQTTRDDIRIQGFGVRSISRSHDRSTIVLNGGPGLFQKYDVATGQFSAPRSATQVQYQPTVDFDGDRILVGYQVFDGSLELLRTVSAPPNSRDWLTQISPDGNYVYIIHPAHGVVRSRVSDGAIMDRIRLAANVGKIEVSADGAFLVLLAEGPPQTSRVLVVDLR